MPGLLLDFCGYEKASWAEKGSPALALIFLGMWAGEWILQHALPSRMWANVCGEATRKEGSL